MNTNTNHLVDISAFTEEQKTKLAEQGYEPIPDELDHASRVALRGKRDAYISKTSGGKLSRWAKKKREKRKKLAMAGKI